VIIIVIIPSLIYFFVNVFIFKYIRSSFRNVQCRSQITQTTDSKISQIRISRHDIHLLRYTIYTFCAFIGGWCPICILITVDFGDQIPVIVYIILSLLAAASLFSIIINLFRYNQKLRHYLKSKVLRQR
jgi:ABC-type polysaccharide/polyol phosphate export permease